MVMIYRKEKKKSVGIQEKGEESVIEKTGKIRRGEK